MQSNLTLTSDDLDNYTQPNHPRAKPFREPLRQALQTYCKQHKLTIRGIARELGVNSTAVSKYLNSVPEGDVAKLEQRIADAIKAAPKRREVAEDLFVTSVTRALANKCDLVRKTNDFGLIHGPAGIGKSCGVDLYAAANATCILIRLSKWNGYAGGVEAALFAQMEGRSKPRNVSRAAWMVEQLRGSNRLIIVDNAQRLTKGGLEWLFDFHDSTSCGIALVGNPSVLAKISSDDQQYSRIGYARPIELKRYAEAAQALLDLHCPEHAQGLQALAQKVAKERGHLRALKKHLLLLPELLAAAEDDVPTAFRMAHTQLVNDYDLSLED